MKIIFCLARSKEKVDSLKYNEFYTFFFLNPIPGDVDDHFPSEYYEGRIQNDRLSCSFKNSFTVLFVARKYSSHDYGKMSHCPIFLSPGPANERLCNSSAFYFNNKSFATTKNRFLIYRYGAEK